MKNVMLKIHHKIEMLSADLDTYNIDLTPTETFDVFFISIAPYYLSETFILDLGEIISLNQFSTRQNLNLMKDLCEISIISRRSQIKELTFNKFNSTNSFKLWLTNHFSYLNNENLNNDHPVNFNVQLRRVVRPPRRFVESQDDEYVREANRRRNRRRIISSSPIEGSTHYIFFIHNYCSNYCLINFLIFE